MNFPVLEQFSLSVAPGEKLAIVGPNGAGKSSLLALIDGLYEPQAGKVAIDGLPLRSIPEEWLRNQIAVVLQETFLFAGTLWENIGYGRAAADRAAIRAAAEAALIDEFATQLPDGYDTRLGDRGVGLSGGQRQRVGIARARVLDAPVVLLDEPTSGLDQEAEALVVAALGPLMDGRTLIMTTHRPALLALADRVLELPCGRERIAGAQPDSPWGSRAVASAGCCPREARGRRSSGIESALRGQMNSSGILCEPH